MKSKFLSSAIALATVFAVFPAPAFAQIDPVYGTQPELDAQCDALLNPDENSGFVTFAMEGETSTSSVTTDDGASTVAGIGASTTSVGNHRSARVNGQSVNIHALVDIVTSFAAGALETTPTKTTVTTTTSATCHVHKLSNQNGHGNEDADHEGYNVAPPGLQITTPVSTSTSEVTYGSRTSSIAGPWVDIAATTYGAQVVICISPDKRSNTWRMQNGYTGNLGTCSRAWYDQLGSTPSASLPTS